MKIKKFIRRLEKLDYAFQPIVTTSGIIIGVEALLRNTDKLGFKSIHNFFDYLARHKILFDVEYILRDKAFSKFKKIPFSDKIKLFYNYDPRILDMPNYEYGIIDKLLEKYNISFDCICIESSERISHNMKNGNLKVYNRAKQAGINFALDDFGVAFSNLQLLYYLEPDFIKIDKFFVENIDADSKKKLLCEQIIKLGHITGAKIIAEGVETIKEYFTLKELGVDGFQGYLISKPVTDISKLQKNYANIRILAQSEKRTTKFSHLSLLKNELEKIEPISITDSITTVFERLKKLKIDYIPVVDSVNIPLGIIREKDLRVFTYSLYGKDLLQNSSFHKGILEFVKEIGICDIKDDIEKIIETYSMYLDYEGIIITDELKYLGFLNSKSIIKILNEKKVLEAKDLNPLTKLPGNISIAEKINKITSPKESCDYLIYYDFNNFKPFNDKFGFRIGDRAILSFAETLKKNQPINFKNKFTGHVGGDDFIEIISCEKECIQSILEYVNDILTKFKNFTYNFYNENDQKEGYYISKDRYGVKRKFEFLDASAAVLEIPPIKTALDENYISRIASDIKKLAKQDVSKISALSIYKIF